MCRAMPTGPDASYQNALRAAREVWVPESPDFARREVLDRLFDHHTAKLLRHGLVMGMGWIKLRDLVEGDPDKNLTSVLRKIT